MGSTVRAAGRLARSALGTPKVWLWILVWVLTRALIVAHVGFWNDVTHVQLQDAHTYETWSHELSANHAIPDDEAWQYPPGAAFLILIPRLFPAAYGQSFVGLMLLFDLAGLALLALLGRRQGRDTGVWVWLLGMPLLGVLPVLRFDLVPTVLTIAALVVIQRRPVWFGALLGIGAAVKAWPVVALLGEWNRRRLVYAIAAAIAAIALVLAASAVFFGNPSGFLTEQNGRGLQIESVAATPWHLRQLVSGEAPPVALRFGAWEIASPTADAVAGLLKWLSVAVLVAAGTWWWARSRAIRAGRSDLERATVSRDFVFAVTLLLVVVSRVLSPQYMIWLLGLAAVVLSDGDSRLTRPAWIALGAVMLTFSEFGPVMTPVPTSDSGFVEATLLRNVALLAAALDASIAMLRLVPLRRLPGAGAIRRSPVPARTRRSS